MRRLLGRFAKLSRRSRGLLLLGIIGLVLFGPGLVELTRLSFKQHQLDRRLAQLTSEHTQLAKQRHRLEHDPTYVEGLIRSTFKWAQKGETVVLLDDDVRDPAR